MRPKQKGPSSSAFKKLLSVYMHNPLIMLNKMTRFYQRTVIDTLFDMRMSVYVLAKPETIFVCKHDFVF